MNPYRDPGENAMASKPETRIQELHLTLPNPPKPVAKYKPAVREGNVLYVSGHGPLKPDGKLIEGRVGKDLTLEQGKEAARVTGLAILATVRNTLGSLDKVKRLIKTLGMVNATPEFRDHPQVINGFTVWMAGGGVKGGLAYGTTDEFGFDAVENRMHVHDLHATILHLMGMDHEKLTYRYGGRDFRLTDVYGTVHKGIIA
jgi:enamine deaminase RidA (YjgF/YER057c/UK114 family)